VDTAATVSADEFRAVLETLCADKDVHAVIALILRTGATGDLLQAVAEAELSVPLTVVVLNQPEAVRLVPARDGHAPSYAYPEVAARALSRAVKYAQWRATPRQTVPAFPDVDAEQARNIVHRFLAGRPDGGRLPQQDAADLLAVYRIPLAPGAAGPGAGVAASVADQAGYPVWRVGVLDDQMFGPLVVLGPGSASAGGSATGAAAGPVARLAPLTEADADALISSAGAAHPSLGHSDAAADSLAELRDVLLRLSRLSDDLPEITQLDLNPVIVRPGGTVAAGARIRVAPQAAQDPFLRRLR
jgi:hypothetical protein